MLARLSLFVRVLTQAPTTLMLLLQCANGAPRSWLRAVATDIGMFTSTPKFESMNGSSLSGWARMVRFNPNSVQARACICRICAWLQCCQCMDYDKEDGCHWYFLPLPKVHCYLRL